MLFCGIVYIFVCCLVVGVVLTVFDEREFERWVRSAWATLDSARSDIEGGFFNWACFKAHQVAEKALKAVLWGVGRPRLGHSLVVLLREVEGLGLSVPGDVREYCFLLSKYYMITRYPDTWDTGIPEEYFTRREAEEAVKAARRILEWVEDVWRELRRRGGS